jgi:acetyl-CoA carboxylase biotin carboxyl carrier protein
MKKNDLEVEKSFIDYLVKTIKDKNLSSLEVTRTLEDKHRLKIKINNSVSDAHSQEIKTLKLDNNSFQSEELILERKSQSSTENLNVIKSPMVGTVYLSPSPEEPTFIEVGKKLKKGDTILIIEAMKTMNQIPSTIEGTVKEILVNNESPVEFDTPLVIIEP